MIVAPVTVRLVSGVVEPMAPVKLTVPVPAVIVNGPVPSTVVEKLTFAPLIVLMTVAAFTVTGPVSVTADPAVVILPYRLMIPV